MSDGRRRFSAKCSPPCSTPKTLTVAHGRLPAHQTLYRPLVVGAQEARTAIIESAHRLSGLGPCCHPKSLPSVLALDSFGPGRPPKRPPSAKGAPPLSHRNRRQRHQTTAALVLARALGVWSFPWMLKSNSPSRSGTQTGADCATSAPPRERVRGPAAPLRVAVDVHNPLLGQRGAHPRLRPLRRGLVSLGLRSRREGPSGRLGPQSTHRTLLPQLRPGGRATGAARRDSVFGLRAFSKGPGSRPGF